MKRVVLAKKTYFWLRSSFYKNSHGPSIHGECLRNYGWLAASSYCQMYVWNPSKYELKIDWWFFTSYRKLSKPMCCFRMSSLNSLNRKAAYFLTKEAMLDRTTNFFLLC